MSKSVFPMFSSKSFIVSGLTYKSLINLEFIFVYGVRECSNFILLHGLSSFSSTTYWRGCLFSIVCSCPLCCKYATPYKQNKTQNSNNKKQAGYDSTFKRRYIQRNGSLTKNYSKQNFFIWSKSMEKTLSRYWISVQILKEKQTSKSPFSIFVAKSGQRRR